MIKMIRLDCVHYCNIQPTQPSPDYQVKLLFHNYIHREINRWRYDFIVIILDKIIIIPL